MRQYFLSLVLSLICAGAVWAEALFVQPVVTQATVYPSAARVTMELRLDVPAGRHQVVFPFEGQNGPPQLQLPETIKVHEMRLDQAMPYDPHQIYTELQARAEAALVSAQSRVDELQDELTQNADALAALEAQKAILTGALSTGEAGMNAEQILLAAKMAGEAMIDLAAQRRVLAQQGRALTEGLNKAQQAVTAAQAAFDASYPPRGTENMAVLDIEKSTDAPAIVQMVTTSPDAEWTMLYDLRLDRDSGQLRIQRNIGVVQYGDLPWFDVAMTLSTNETSRDTEPYNVWPRPADLRAKPDPKVDLAEQRFVGRMEEPMMEPEVITGDVSLFTSGIEGLNVVYRITDPITVTDTPTVRPLGELVVPVGLSNVAVPRRQDTAFLVAELTNDLGEPLLPGRAQLFRDGAFIGEAALDYIPAGETTKIGFGTLEGLRLDYRLADKVKGDTGLIGKKEQRRETEVLEVRNLTGRPETVTVLHALPFSQDEDLQISTRVTPAASQTDVGGDTGVTAWDLNIDAGETQTITLEHTAAWPPEFNLIWR